MERLVLAAVVAHGSRGATWLELWRYLDGKLERQSISPRFRPLCEKGMLTERYTDDGRRIVRPGESNRNQTVWFATPQGEAWLQLRRRP